MYIVIVQTHTIISLRVFVLKGVVSPRRSNRRSGEEHAKEKWKGRVGEVQSMESWRDAFGGRLLIFLAQRALREGQQPFESVWRLLQKNRTLKEKRHRRRRIPKGYSANFLGKSVQKVHKGLESVG